MVNTKMLLNKNMKATVRSPGDDSVFFDIVAEISREDLLAAYILIIYQDFVFWTSIELIKENGFTLKIK